MRFQSFRTYKINIFVNQKSMNIIFKLIVFSMHEDTFPTQNKNGFIFQKKGFKHNFRILR